MSQFTKKALIDSFVKILNTTSLDKITVKDIVNDCGVNRNTFYYYFQDIYALLEEIFKEETKNVLEENILYDSWQEGFLQVTKFAIENKQAIYHIYNSLSREKLESYLFSVTDNLMFSFVDSQSEGMDVSLDDKRFISDFYKHALVGLLLNWVNNGMKDDPKIFIIKIGELFEGNIKNALDNSVKYSRQS